MNTIAIKKQKMTVDEFVKKYISLPARFGSKSFGNYERGEIKFRPAYTWRLGDFKLMLQHTLPYIMVYNKKLNGTVIYIRDDGYFSFMPFESSANGLVLLVRDRDLITEKANILELEGLEKLMTKMYWHREQKIRESVHSNENEEAV